MCVHASLREWTKSTGVHRSCLHRIFYDIRVYIMCMCVRVLCVHVCMYVCACMCTYMCVCMCVCIRICVYTCKDLIICHWGLNPGWDHRKNFPTTPRRFFQKHVLILNPLHFSKSALKSYYWRLSPNSR